MAPAQRTILLAAIGLICTATVNQACKTPPQNAQQTAPQTAPQTAQKTAKAPVLRTPDGRPDLQGVWDFALVTPMERPAQFGDRAFLTDQEAAAAEEQARKRGDPEGRVRGTVDDVAAAYNGFWSDPGTKVARTRRTSLIIDPPNGRFPPLTPEGAKEDAARQAFVARDRADGPEDRDLGERCILGFNAGPPMMPSAYNNLMQLIQTGDSVAILTEMNHDVRIVPLDGRAHLPSQLRQWYGDARGHWEGDTLVVETTNFDERVHGFRSTQLHYHGYAGAMRVIERFTRADADTLMYEATIDNPAVYSRPWTFQLPMMKTNAPILEYACHEGNHAMRNMLSGARVLDKERTARR